MITDSQPTTFGLIRHATTMWNEKKMIQGQHDSPLSQAGQEMAVNWGRKLSSFPWQRIVCSDLGRACKTSELINQTLKLPIHQDKRLREQDWGGWSGMTLSEVKEKHGHLLREQVRSGWLFRPPGGESRKEVLKRNQEALNEAHSSWSGETILIICHEGVIKCLLYHLAERKFLPEEQQLVLPKHLHFVVQQDETLYLKEINCMHL